MIIVMLTSINYFLYSIDTENMFSVIGRKPFACLLEFTNSTLVYLVHLILDSLLDTVF